MSRTDAIIQNIPTTNHLHQKQQQCRVNNKVQEEEDTEGMASRSDGHSAYDWCGLSLEGHRAYD